ncbi:phosphate transport system regulatory protein PhoU [Gracilibacillus boraciitolerans JCM 21714]|uniref:Phosphate-specific transport system accessory protein PhoU n=1 Tax=Gracilibacillus boraciitolerans JCM 21714 TaxID=1298598 RepID=W4VDD8_9BACI|nr:phosphate signaling complex protein PhoU [Gracilibacillus boraciitolerans]GAE91196.1 phosphate transport system regulatory protein PhoU [Gracilibacillus boraciitolerans JCM 21714]
MAGREMFQTEVKKVEELIILLAKKSKDQLHQAVDALYNSDIELAEQLIKADKELDKLDFQINEAAILLIARQQPVATDLRRLVVAIRISSDLERMADNAKNIAKSTIHLGKDHGIKIHHSIREMEEIAEKMIDLAIKAYENEDITLARKLAEMDDLIDAMYSSMLRELLEETATDPQKIQHIMQMAFSGRYVERIGDHATNVGEDVMYLVKGESADLNE